MKSIVQVAFVLAASIAFSQAPSTVADNPSAMAVQFGYKIHGHIVDDLKREDVDHFISLNQDHWWIWETTRYYAKIDIAKIFKGTPSALTKHLSELKLSALLTSGHNKIDVPLGNDSDQSVDKLIAKTHFLYVWINGSELKEKYHNVIASRNKWKLNLVISLPGVTTQSFTKDVEPDWSILD